MKDCFPVRFCSLALLVSTATALPCTTFVQKGGGHVYFGRNLDWYWEDGMVVANPRGLQKTAFLMTERSPARWISKYGSVTFNQFGRELPMGGMNEAGLVVENMQLAGTNYAPPDARPALNLEQWIQYQLDTCQTVAEVLATDRQVRIETPPPPLRAEACEHYLICDAAGNCATIEFLGGKTVVHRGAELACPVLANSTYEASTNYLGAHPLASPPPATAADRGSLARFGQAASRTAAYRPSAPAADIAYAFATLDGVAQGDATVWSIVYDVTGRQIHYRTRSNRTTRVIDFKALDFAPGRPVLFANIQTTPQGEAKTPALSELTESRHREYLQHFFGQPAVTQAFGDLSPVVEGLVLTLRTYSAFAPGH